MFLIRIRCRGGFLDFLSDKYESPIALTGKVFFSFKKKEKKKAKRKKRNYKRIQILIPFKGITAFSHIPPARLRHLSYFQKLCGYQRGFCGSYIYWGKEGICTNVAKIFKQWKQVKVQFKYFIKITENTTRRHLKKQSNPPLSKSR